MMRLSLSFRRTGFLLSVLSLFFSQPTLADDDALSHSFVIGKTRLIALYDAMGPITVDLFRGASDEEINRRWQASKTKATINAFIVIRGSEIILIDSGLGAGKGKLLEAIESAGLKPEQVTAIFLTHLHFDHVGGLTRDGKPVFPKAAAYVDSRELAYWNDDKSIASPAQKPMFDKVRGFQSVYGVTGVSPGQTLLPGVTVADEVGHTPGHVGYLIDCGKKTLLVWGDIMHQIDMQMANPDIYLTYDLDGRRAVETRKRVLSRVVQDRLIVAGMHLPFPGVVTIEKAKDGAYRYQPYRAASIRRGN